MIIGIVPRIRAITIDAILINIARLGSMSVRFARRTNGVFELSLIGSLLIPDMCHHKTDFLLRGTSAIDNSAKLSIT